MKAIPRLKFAHLPTPIEALPRLSTKLNGPRLFIKRDDQTGLALGGNKTRKLEFLVAEAQSHGAKTLITAGAVQSNHCRQTAAAAARFGLECIIVLYGSTPARHSGNLLLDKLFGAEIIWAERPARDTALEQTFKTAWEAGRRPYLIPYGGSNATGAAGYVFAIKELQAQIGRDNLLNAPPDWIIFPSSSGGTQAGMVAGTYVFNLPSKILGISVDEKQAELQHRVARLAEQTLDLLGESARFSPKEIFVNADYLGGGYGILGEDERRAIDLFARYEGIILDPVYTGRAASGMIDLILQGFFEKDANLLFWHTGGSPALFAEQYQQSLLV